MKKIFFLLLAISLVSCSKSNDYRDDLSCADLAREICDEADVSSGYSEYEKEHVAFLFDSDALYDDCSVIYSTDVTDINEIGVFHCENKDNAKGLAEIITKYITDMQTEQKAFIASYAPRELPKLDGAEVHQYGNYVIYLIIDDGDKQDVIEEIEEKLKK